MTLEYTTRSAALVFLLPWLHMLSTGWQYLPVKGVHSQGSSDIGTEGTATDQC